MTTALEVNWDSIRHAGDHVMPEPFDAYDQDGNPTDIPNLWNVSRGQRVEDRNGNRFRFLGCGAYQGDVVLRDRYGRQFYADGNMRMMVLGEGRRLPFTVGKVQTCSRIARFTTHDEAASFIDTLDVETRDEGGYYIDGPER